MNELKPCPLCGSERARLDSYEEWTRVLCPKCGCNTDWCVTAYEAKETWNTRAHETTSRAVWDEADCCWICDNCKYDFNYEYDDPDYSAAEFVNNCPCCGAVLEK